MNLFFILLKKWGLISVFILIGLEYACFPIPSEMVLPFVGFLAKLNEYNVFGIIILSVIVGYLGSLICYLIGYYGGAYLYNKIYYKFTKWQKGLDAANKSFNKYGNVSIFISRLIPLCRTYISFFAGLFKQSLLVYSFYSILGISIWNSILVILGYILADKWDIIGKYYNNYKLVLLIIFIIFFGFLMCKLYKKRKLTKTINGD